MPTSSQARFEANATDARHLLEIHQLIGGGEPGRRGPALQVLNRSGIVLVCAIWEAYCEDLAAEALDYIVNNVPKPDALPKVLRKRVAQDLRSEKNDLSMWKLAGDGWKAYLKQRLASLQEERNRGLNTPKATNIEKLFEDALGLKDVSAGWHWPKMTKERARSKLNEYVELRGDIAHRGAVEGVQRDKVEDFLGHIERLVRKTDTKVNDFVCAECGSGMF